MDVRTKSRPTCPWRLCVRLALALCLVVFFVGDAVERGFAGHASLDAVMTHAVTADQQASLSTDHSGLHIDGQSGDVERGGQVVGHGCHACAALPEPTRQVAAAPPALGLSPAWASVPSPAGREPLVDLPPPRA